MKLHLSTVCPAIIGLTAWFAAAAQTPPAGGLPAGAPGVGGPPPLAPGAGPGGPAAGDTGGNDLKPAEKPDIDAKRFFTELMPPLPADTPQPSADLRDLTGAWFHSQPLDYMISYDLYGNVPPYTPRAHRLLAHRIEATRVGKPYLNPSSYCQPPGLPWQQDLNMPFQIFQTKNLIQIVHQEYHGLVTVYMNPADVPKQPSYMGNSVGHWDGDTLVTETNNFKQPLWLDVTGTPASANAKITQRIRKVHQSVWFLEILTTIDDPVYYTRPWSWVRTFAWRPDKQMFIEYDCETQLGDKQANAATKGLYPEPASDDQ